MTQFLPLIVFAIAFAGALVVLGRSRVAVTRLSRHEITGLSTSAPRVTQTESILATMTRGGMIGKLIARLFPEERREKAERMLAHAGNPMPLGTFLLLRIGFIAVVMPGLLFYVYRDQGMSIKTLVVMGFLAFITPNTPNVYLKRKIRKREREIERAMPDALDLLVVCVESGMSLDGGMQQVSQRTEGLLAAELDRTLNEFAAGVSRRDALTGLATRTSAPSLGLLVTTIIQSDKMGVSIATTLRTLAVTLRDMRRQSAETQARKAPIKMMPFIVFFMLPALFAVILGPVVIGIMGLS